MVQVPGHGWGRGNGAVASRVRMIYIVSVRGSECVWVCVWVCMTVPGVCTAAHQPQGAVCSWVRVLVPLNIPGAPEENRAPKTCLPRVPGRMKVTRQPGRHQADGRGGIRSVRARGSLTCPSLEG